MTRLVGWALSISFILFFCGPALAITAPNPLQSAYWRFEEGTNGSNVNFAAVGPVRDSINANHMDAFDATTSPVYTNTVAPTPLASGLPNTLALDFIPHDGGGDDLFTEFHGAGTPINNGTIAPGGGFTVEAAFNTNEPARFAAIIGKEGRPGGSRPQPTFVLKTRGDDSKLQVELWDGQSNLVQVSSTDALNGSQWYYAAVVNTGSTLSLYLDSNDGNGYELQGSVAVAGALFQGNPANASWDNSWTIGRGQFGGAPADWFDGIIDEVRLTNSALSPSQFLFAAPDAGIVGDYNDDGKVDAADYVIWRKYQGTNTALPNDPVGGTIGTTQYNNWRANFGDMAPGGAATTVPEPLSGVLLALAVLMGVAIYRPSSRRWAAQPVWELSMTHIKHNVQRVVGYLFAFAVAASTAVADTPSNPLQSAYWRFEEGAVFNNVNHTIADPVLDSINANHLDAFDANTAPLYTNDLPPRALRSGLPNTRALDFIPHDGGGDDLFTLYSDGDFGKGQSKSINNGFVAPGGGFTVEAAFKSNETTRFAAIIGKEGQPAGSRPVQTFVIKTRQDNSKLQVEMHDGFGIERQVSSLAVVNDLQWYYVAAVATDTTLSLYLDSGSGYVLQGSTPINGAIFQGNPANPLWDASWTVGRGQFAGNPADWWDGVIDEVRITNSALTPSQFLFADPPPGATIPEPGSVALCLMALSCAVLPRAGRLVGKQDIDRHRY
jgi:hypothetical protein